MRRTRLAGDTLFMVGIERTPIVPLDGGRFRAGPGTEVRFEGNASTPSRMIVRTTTEEVAYTRADTAALTPVQLAGYAGDYRSREVDATHTWRIEKGELVPYMNDRRLGVLEAGRVRQLRFTRVR